MSERKLTGIETLKASADKTLKESGIQSYADYKHIVGLLGVSEKEIDHSYILLMEKFKSILLEKYE